MMTQEQLTFCKRVAEAIRIYREYHPDYEITEKQDKIQEQYNEEFQADTNAAMLLENEDDQQRRLVIAKYTYYRKMNILLKEISGVGVPELIGTGDNVNDFNRAMDVVNG